MTKRVAAPLGIGFVGNCQTQLLQRAFRTMTRDHVGSFYHFYEMTPQEELCGREDLARCDTLFVQDIRNFDDYPLRPAIGPHTRIVRFPFLSFAAPWPWDDFNGFRDTVARGQDDPSVHTTTYYDGALARLRREVPDSAARLEAYRTLAFKGLVAPHRVLDFERRRLEAMDEKFGLSIGRTILTNFRHEPLFYTVNRPNGRLLADLLAFLFDALDLKPPPPAPELDELGDIQVPIHPRVAQDLGIDWATEGRLYRNGMRQMTWRDHVAGYIARYT
jgi:hypothetical protein